MTTAKQMAANQANAQHSTGPITAEGKAKSSLNAVKSGLTGFTVLLPNDDVALYEAHVAALTAQHSPVGPAEQALVQSIANAEWRLRRIETLEFGIYAMGNLEFAPEFANEPDHLRANLIQGKTYMAYKKDLRNLQLQESRIRRHRQDDLDELNDLQGRRAAEREAQRRQQLTAAARSLIKAFEAGTGDTWTPQANGFEFSFAEIAVRLHELKPDLFDAFYPTLREKMAA
jgi:hypothetical protein